jgi:hypothetical protein
MTRKPRPLLAPALIAMVALISGCGSSRSAQTSGGGTVTGANAKKAVKFAECMRKNGVSQFPDPPASGNFTIDAIANGSSLNTDTPAFTQALSACKGLEPAGFTGSTWTPEQMSAALNFAQCMRENGVSDFPDPVNGQPLVDTNRIPSSQQPGGMSAIRAAMQQCRGIAAQAIGKQP